MNVTLLHGADAGEDPEDPVLGQIEEALRGLGHAVTRVSVDHVPDGVYDAVAPHFSEAELVALTFAIVTINSWNRLNIALRTEAGGYRPGMFNQLLKTA